MKAVSQKLGFSASEKYLQETKYCLKSLYKETTQDSQSLLAPTVTYLKTSKTEWATKIDILTGLFPQRKFKLSQIKREMEKQELIPNNIRFSNPDWEIDSGKAYGQFMQMHELYTLSQFKLKHPEITKIIYLLPYDSQEQNYKDTKQPTSDAKMYFCSGRTRAIDVKSGRIEHNPKSQLYQGYYDEKTKCFPGILNKTVSLPEYLSRKQLFFKRKNYQFDESESIEKTIKILLTDFSKSNITDINTIDKMNNMNLDFVHLDTNRYLISEYILWEPHQISPSEKETIKPQILGKFQNINYFNNLTTRSMFVNEFIQHETPELLSQMQKRTAWKPSFLPKNKTWEKTHIDDIESD